MFFVDLFLILCFRILDNEDLCPMCSEKIDARKLVKIEDPKVYLNVE